MATGSMLLERRGEHRLRCSRWCLKTGMIVALWSVYIVGMRADAQQPCPPVLFSSDGGSSVGGDQSCALESETPDYVDPVAGVTLLGGRVSTNVASSSALTAALRDQNCGETLILADGTYADDRSITANCPANNPFIVKCANALVCKATGTWTISGARNIVTGLHFTGGRGRVRLHGVNNKLIGNKFSGWNAPFAIAVGDTSGQSGNEIAYNELGPGGSGAFRWTIKGYSGTSESSVAKDVWIHHNRFRDLVSDDGRGDAIEAGESGWVPWVHTLKSGWYVEDNLFTNMQDDGQAIVDMKYGGAVIRRNTVSDSANVRIQARFGTNSIWESNYMKNGILQVNGSGHKMVCNFGTLRVLAGEAEWDALNNLHHRSVGTLVAKNDGSIVVGHKPNNAYTYVAQRTTIQEHSGRVSLVAQSGEVDQRTSPSSYSCTPATELMPSHVGPAAIAGAPSKYRAARGL